MRSYLSPGEIIDFETPSVRECAETLSRGCKSDEAIARACFEYVRDEIAHTGDAGGGVTTLRASEVLERRSGWCYAKSHLLAALLRANDIPAALCYQRLSCSEYEPDLYCLHGLNAVYLNAHGWYRCDPRGNKAGIDARFAPPVEKLAFKLGANEYDVEGLFAEPIREVLEALRANDTYEKMVGNFPDLEERA